MKTTIDIPDPLYRTAKIRAVESGLTLRQLVLAALRRELDAAAVPAEAPRSYWANRKLLPEFAAAQESGALRPKPGDRPIDDLIDEIKADVAL